MATSAPARHALVFKHLLQAGGFSVVQLAPDAPLPEWVVGVGLGGAPTRPFTSVTRTGQEVSVVCPTACVPQGGDTAAATIRAHEPGWAALAIHMGALPFGLTGVLLAALAPLAAAGVGIFALSTYNTDVILVKTSQLGEAVAALRGAGHTVEGGGAPRA